MRTYLILKDKAARWNADPEIKALLAEADEWNGRVTAPGGYTKDNAAALKAQSFDRENLASKGLKYERLDQLTIDILLGVR
jgi:xylose isomerase